MNRQQHNLIKHSKENYIIYESSTYHLFILHPQHVWWVGAGARVNRVTAVFQLSVHIKLLNCFKGLIIKDKGKWSELTTSNITCMSLMTIYTVFKL